MVLRYVFNDAPPYVEQVALLLVISVAMFGAAAGVRDAGPHRPGFAGAAAAAEGAVLVQGRRRTLLSIVFALALLWRQRARWRSSTHDDTIPTLGISEAFRYLPPVIAGVLITLFSIEHLIAPCSGARGRSHHGTDRPLRRASCVFLVLGVPVAFAIGLSCLATFAVEGLPLRDRRSR